MQTAARLASDLSHASRLQAVVRGYVGTEGIDFPTAPQTASWPATVDALISIAKGTSEGAGA